VRRHVIVALLLVCAVAQSSALQRAAGGSQIALRIGFARPGGGYTVETIPLEIYIARVLAGEAARDSPPAALEALAITIRTFAIANLGRHRADDFDLCDETHCQVVRNATATTTRAAQVTAGQILTRDGVAASVFYSASCGGRTEIPSNVWPGADDPAYLPTAADEACEGAPHWEAELSGADLLRAFKAAGFRGNRLRNIRIASRNSSDRVARLRLDGLTPNEISGQDLRVVVGRTLGWQHIKSAAFELRQVSSGYRFEGHGSGHGVGLCVIGSTNLAARGTSAGSILQKYFPGTAIAPAASVPDSDAAATGPEPTVAGAPKRDAVLLSLPDDDEGERAMIARVTIEARAEIAKALGVEPPAALMVRFHPTTDSFERSTGQPWFTSGAWVHGELHLLPLAVLRERGVLERTIRHELVHQMADEVLARRPAWIREGAAIYFAGERFVPGEAARDSARPALRAACPTDNELLQPVSIGTLANAYARARACFVRQIEGGRRWQDVR
jgi:stage II sporulation protein D (peptidoglycan lytic transglycosylase)